MGKLQINESDFVIVKGILEKEPYKFGFFGSRAKATAYKHSDLDIVIFSDEDLPLSYISDLKEKFSTSNLPYFVDIVDYNACDDSFKGVIDDFHISFKLHD